MVLCGKCGVRHPRPVDVKNCYGRHRALPPQRKSNTQPETDRTGRRTVAAAKFRPVTAKSPDALSAPGGWVGSGLVHSPGRSEQWLGSECEHCGAKVPDGSAHDC